jgi:mannosyltransferase OCH1-like enzyme
MIYSIPKRILQTDKSRHLPPLQRAAVESVRLHNPDFEHLFFEDPDVEAFFDQHAPEYRKLYNSFPFRIQKYDFFRYVAVYKLGGFYFDTDMVLAAGLSDLTGYGCVFPFERLTWSAYLRSQYRMDWEIGNYAFGAAAGHPFLAAVIQNCARAQAEPQWAAMMTRSLPRVLREELEVIYTTGPGLVSRTLAEYSGQEHAVRVLFPANVCDKRYWNLFGDYGVHLGSGSWRVAHSYWKKRLVHVLGVRNEQRAIRDAARLGATRPLALANKVHAASSI